MMENTTFEQKYKLIIEQKRILGDRKRHLIALRSYEDVCIAYSALQRRFPDVRSEIVDVKTFHTVKFVGDCRFSHDVLAAWIQGYMEGREAVRGEV
jgi:hypothetical protein